MLALKEFANFIFLNLANLATTYDRLLAENDEAYRTLPADTRIASARRLIKAVAEACEAGTPDPFRQHFDNPNKNAHLPGAPKPAQPLQEIECLSQTLTPVVTNLEAGKFLWHLLSEARATTLHSLANGSVVLLLRPAAPATRKEMGIPRPEEEQLPSSPATVSKIEGASIPYGMRSASSASPLPPEEGGGEQAIQIQNKIILDLVGSEKLYESDLSTALEEITRVTAQVLNVQRISIWFYNQDHSAIRCAKLYELNENRYSDGVELEAKVYPAYFEALTTKRIIAAHEAHTHPQTREFSKNYLTPLSISSMLDVPIQLEGRMVGVVCHEHIGPVRQWTAQEQAFALSIASLVARVLSTYEHRQTEEQLRKFSRAVEQSANSIVITDTAGYIQYVNRKFTETTGYTPEEAMGKHTRILKSGVTSAEEYKRLWETITSGGEWQGEFCNRKKNRETYWEFASISPIKDEQGVITHFLAVKEDITERKRVEGALDQERKLLRTLIDNLPNTNIFVKDSASRFITTNLAHLQVLGNKSLEEVAGKTDFDLFPAELAGQYYADEQAVIKSGQPLLNRVEPVTDSAGKPRWYLTNKIPLRDEHGAVVGLVGMSLDITERKQLEQQIQESLERRARQIETTTEIAQQISTAAALDDLFRRVVSRVQTQFGYYQVQVYTLTEEGLELQAGTGEAGRRMKESGHKIPLTAEESLPVRAVLNGTTVLVPDVSQEPAWRPHPLLSETKAELVVPINLGAEILGVLDVQSDTVGGLNEEDELVLIGLCGQVAVAIDNRRVEAERRRAEEKLSEERNLLRLLIDNLPDQIYIKDAESRFLLVNPAVARNLKVTTPDEVVGKTDFDFLPVEVAEQYYDYERTLLQSGQSQIDFEESGFDPELGITRWILSTKIPFPDSQGRIAGLVGLNREITPLKQVQETLAQTLSETETLYQASASLNLAQTYEDILEVLRRYTLVGQGAQNVSLNQFDRPWTDKQLPVWINVLARYSELSQENVSARYLISAFPSISQLLCADAPTLIENVQNDPRMDNNARMLYGQQFGAKSTLFVPLTVGGQWVGYINAIYQQPKMFPEAEVRRLTTLTGQAAVAIQAIQRLAETEARLQEIQALQQFSQSLAGTLQVNEIFNIFFQACARITGFEYVQFSLVDQKQQRVKAVAGFNVSETQIRQANHPLDSRDIMADIIRTGRTEIITGWDDRFDKEVFEAEGHAQWVRIFTPVILRGENVGLVEAGYNKNVQVMPQEAQIRLLTALIDQIMLALDNAQRYEATQKTAQREQTIREITEKMRAATSLQDLVKTTARELGQRLSAEHAVVELGIETDTTTLRPGNSIQNRS